MFEHLPEASRLFIETLEHVSFQFAEQIEANELSHIPDDLIDVTLDYRGAPNGSIQFATSRDFSRQLAANMLGCEIDDPSVEPAIEDSIGELCNIYAGQLMPVVYDPSKQFMLGIPIHNRFDGDRFADLSKKESTIVFLIDEEYPFLLSITESEQ